MHDRLGRALRDLRVSVTDRCNLRCRYCMPREAFGADHAFLTRPELLTAAELERVVRVAAGLGVHKIRITGGEPSLRSDLVDIVARFASVGIPDLAMTTNGMRLAATADALRTAGLDRVTVSLDALDEPTARAIADAPVSIDAVLAGVTAALAAGLGVKLNTVVRRGVNEHAVEPLVELARELGVTVRFIEYMDVGTTNGWRHTDVVPSEELRAGIAARWPLTPVAPVVDGEVATRWRFLDGHGEVGFVSSVTAPFCGDCVRARLSAAGELFTCLFASTGTDLRTPLRAGVTDDELAELIAGRWATRDDRYSERRAELAERGPDRVEMSYVGG